MDFRRVIRAFRQRAPASPLASSLVCLSASSPLRHHHQAQVPSAGPTCPLQRRGRLPLFVALSKRWSHRPVPLQPSSVQRLPRPTGLPARTFAVSGVVAIATTPAPSKAPSPTQNTRPGRSAKLNRPTTLEGDERAYKNITFQGTPSPSPPTRLPEILL